jgi:hypothetical protein
MPFAAQFDTLFVQPSILDEKGAQCSYLIARRTRSGRSFHHETITIRQAEVHEGRIVNLRFLLLNQLLAALVILLLC